MKKQIQKITYFVILISPLIRAHACENIAAKLVSGNGLAERQPYNHPEWLALNIGDELCIGDNLRVSQDTMAIRLTNETLVRLEKNSVVRLRPPKKSIWLELLKGAGFFLSRTPQPFTVEAPYVNAAIEGTEFLVRHTPKTDEIHVYEGHVLAKNSQGETHILAGEKASTPQRQQPDKSRSLNGLEGIQWAMHFPLILTPSLVISSHPNNAQHDFKTLERHIDQGRIQRARHWINRELRQEKNNTKPEAAYYQHLLKIDISLALYQGDMHFVKKSLARYKDTNDPFILSFQALNQWLDVSQTATQKNVFYQQLTNIAKTFPESPVPHWAKSYIEQKQFELQKAWLSAQTALKNAPNNSRLHARVAELALSLGFTDKAKQALSQAQKLNPNLARIYTLQGLLATQYQQSDAANTLFKKAIHINSEDPLAHFGQGLNQIQQGHIVSGRQSIELAVLLDPANSLYRSYLGKSYLHEKRFSDAGKQFDVASQLDPFDPTPWLYSALKRQSENNLPEAIQALNQSLERNDNRGVYRSRWMLDRDTATRNANLGAIYQQLNFQPLAMNISHQDLALRFNEYATHKLRADTMAKDIRLNLARSSEYLQAQIRQPLSGTPISALQTEADLQVFDGFTPSQFSLNEYSRIYDKRGFAGNVAFNHGSGTRAHQVNVSGMHRQWAFNVGQYRYHSDALGRNGEQTQTLSTASVQKQMGVNTKTFIEYRQQAFEDGVLNNNMSLEHTDSRGSRFNQSRLTSDSHTLRLGLHHAIAPRIELLAIIDRIQDDAKSQNIRQVDNTDFSLKTTRNSRSRDEIIDGELQINIQNNIALYSAGLMAARVDRNQKSLIDVTVQPTPSSSEVSDNAIDINFYRHYQYFNIKPFKTLIVTTGFAATQYKRDQNHDAFDQTAFDLKLGLQYTPLDALTFRMAAFETTQLPLEVAQSIEPTTISGFNQVFDDGVLTLSKNLNMGANYRINENLTIGGQHTYRDLKRTLNSQTGELNTRPFSDKDSHLYLLWLYKKLSSTVNVSRNHQQALSDITDNTLPSSLKTLTLKNQWKYFFNNRLSLSFSLTNVSQTSRFESSVQNRDEPINHPRNNDRFFLKDIELSFYFWYRRAIFNIGIKNIDQQAFNYREINFQDGDINRLTYVPERFSYGSFSLYF